MILVNNKKVDDTTFPDGTPLLKSFCHELIYSSSMTIAWHYESDAEMFRLMCIVRDIQNKGICDISLILPYVPNARMDRVHNDDDVFTLKYFAEFINSLNFRRVYVLDAHSDVCLGLINRCYNIKPTVCINMVIERLKLNPDKDLVVYPDAGCKKRLETEIKFPCVYGDKHRDWQTGKILGTDIYGDLTKLNEGARVLFVDDICAYGGTAKFTLEALKKLGASECYCYFTHIEKSIFGKKDWRNTGEGTPTLLNSGLVEKIFHTDSLTSSEDVCEEDKLGVSFVEIPVSSFIHNYM